MKRCYPSGSNKRKKRKDTDKYLATLPKMTHFFTATVVGVGDTDRNNAQSIEHAATAASATASCEVALVVVEDNINQEINEKDITLLPPAVTDSVIDFDTDEVEELSSDGHFDTDDDDDGALAYSNFSLDIWKHCTWISLTAVRRHQQVIFPIEIRRLSVPVLFDPGKDVNSQVTVLIKAFLRYKELRVLINSIRWGYPKIKIIVADDSLNPEKVVGDNIEHYIMPPAQGWFAGRNLAVSQVTTKYFLWVDDDFVFLNETRIESFVNIMEAVPELDVVGGQVGENQFSFQLKYEEGNSEEGGCITRVHRTHAPLPGFNGCFFADGVVNYFLGRTDAVRRVGFDPFLKRVAHTEFFVDALGDLLVVTCKGLRIGHQKHSSTNKYGSYRHPPKSDSNAKMTHHFFKNHLKCIKY